jgi:hypothetical protein
MNHFITKISLILVFSVYFDVIFSQVNSENTIPSSNVSYVVSENFNDELFQEILNLQKKINVIVTENSLQNKLADLKSQYSNDLIQNCPNIPDSDFTQIPMRSLQLWVLNFEGEANHYKGFLIETIEKLTK